MAGVACVLGVVRDTRVYVYEHEITTRFCQVYQVLEMYWLNFGASFKGHLNFYHMGDRCNSRQEEWRLHTFDLILFVDSRQGVCHARYIFLRQFHIIVQRQEHTPPIPPIIHRFELRIPTPRVLRRLEHISKENLDIIWFVPLE